MSQSQIIGLMVSVCFYYLMQENEVVKQPIQKQKIEK